MIKVSKENTIFAFSSKKEPVITVKPKEKIIIETMDALSDEIHSEDQPFEAIDWEKVNPATGPIFVEGAKPGDVLEVKIEKIIITRDYGVMLTGKDMGVLGERFNKNYIKIVPIKNDKAYLYDYEIPINPMIGVIGTAPKEDEIPCGTPGEHGGNMDCKVIKEGSIVYLPVNVEGALFALGDLHAAMGDGEVCVTGIEVPAEVTVSFNILKNKNWSLPIIKTEDQIYTVASKMSLDEAAKKATINMVTFLSHEYNLSEEKAMFLLSVVGNLQICQIVDPLKTVRMEMPLEILN
ncbi:acetamidase/formamidase family protein [Petrotoga sp. 9PWA.NaAc.5.4]|uniref:acetamidase/formamidase family protein n=1 Tax=Petrotoga sp. 9PWA.NaAc.5.4 TaxID=1434328 RepID=UPI000CC66152|nr:acetamidase/formamidase family protein [Petrotoga sp. 9PWA.NaAc.5.4]PNR95342.1 acetamidase [Petrotoga sp. 9PWA.NaAc.5.4]